MGLSEKLELLISVDTSGGLAKLEQFAKGVEKSTTAAESSLQRVQKAAKTAFGAGVAGLGVGGLLTNIASGDIEASNQLKAAIEQVGQSYSDFSERIDKTAKAQAEFGHTDEQAVGAITTLTIAYGDTNKALGEMQLVTDLAARKNISLGDAATIVAKAHGGAGRVFKEFGIEVKANADGTKDYDGALGELSQKLTGQASAAADSYGGKLRELKAEAENFASEIGQRFGPAILAGSAILTAAGGATTVYTSRVEKRTVAMLAAAESDQIAAAAATELAASEALVTGNTMAAVASLYEESAAADAAAGSMEGAGVASAGLLGPLALVAGAVIAGMAIWDTYNDSVSVSVDVQKAARTETPDLVRGYEKLNSALGGGADAQKKFAKQLADGGDAGVGALVKLRDAEQNAGHDTSILDDAIKQARTSQDTFNDSAAQGATALGKVGKAATDTAAITNAAMDAQVSSVGKLNSALDQTKSKVEAAATAFAPADIREKRGEISFAEGKQSVADAKTALAAARKSGDPKAVAQATRDLSKAQLDLESTTLDLATAKADLQKQAILAAGGTVSETDEIGFLDSALKGLDTTLTGSVRTAMDGYTTQLDTAIAKVKELTDAQVTNMQTIPGASGAFAAGGMFNTGNAGVGVLKIKPPVTVPGPIHAHALGGMVGAGERFRGGEGGFELAVLGADANYRLPRQAQILDHRKSQALLGGTTHHTENTVNIYESTSPRQTAQAALAELEKKAYLAA